MTYRIKPTFEWKTPINHLWPPCLPPYLLLTSHQGLSASAKFLPSSLAISGPDHHFSTLPTSKTVLSSANPFPWLKQKYQLWTFPKTKYHCDEWSVCPSGQDWINKWRSPSWSAPSESANPPWYGGGLARAGITSCLNHLPKLVVICDFAEQILVSCGEAGVLELNDFPAERTWQTVQHPTLNSVFISLSSSAMYAVVVRKCC